MASSDSLSPSACSNEEKKGINASTVGERQKEEQYSSNAGDEENVNEPAGQLHRDASANHIHGPKLVSALVGLCLAVLLIALDSAVLATAIPVITNEFHSLLDVGWYGSVYLITICACQPFASKILDLYSVKWTYIAFIAIFELGSLICATAPSSVVLIIGRLIAGLGAGGIFSGAMVIIAHVAPLQMRPAYTALIMASYGAASIVGPVIGGSLTQNSTWRWCFYLNLPIGAVVICLLIQALPPFPGRQAGWLERVKELDILGFALFAPAVAMLLLALQWGGTERQWNSATVIGLLCGSTVLLLTFGAWQWHLKDSASIPPSVLTQRTVGLGALTAILANGGINIINYWLPIWFQAILDSTPTESGVQFIPTILANILVSIVGGVAVSKLGYYNPFLLIGMALSAIAAGLFTTFRPDTAEGVWIGYQVIAGLGHGLVIQMPITAVQTVLPLEKIAAGTSILIFSQFFGGALFLTIAQNVFQSQLVAALPKYAPGVNATEILAAGASNFRTMIDAKELTSVLVGYNLAITSVFWIATAGAVVAFALSLGMEWKSVRPPQDLPNEAAK